jgi:PhnB protein
MPTPYVTYDGTCAEAFAFYEKALGGKIESTHTFGNSPMGEKIPKDLHDRVMHSSIRIGGTILMGSDAGPWSPYEGATRSCSLSLPFDDVDKAKAAFAALAEGGTIQMPIDKTFWAEAFGVLTDRFGVSWMINCDGPKAG